MSDTINAEKLGSRIKAARIAHGYTQAILAAKADLSTKYISNIECGAKIPRLETLVLFVNTLDIIQDSNIDDYLDDCFDVNDYIALPIRALNRKDYRTMYCCSGHPYDQVVECTWLNECRDANELMPGVVSQEHLPNGDLHDYASGVIRKRLYPICPGYRSAG